MQIVPAPGGLGKRIATWRPTMGYMAITKNKQTKKPNTTKNFTTLISG
jgi:hypothetical protein